jgi:hypothetical protein
MQYQYEVTGRAQGRDDGSGQRWTASSTAVAVPIEATAGTMRQVSRFHGMSEQAEACRRKAAGPGRKGQR